MDTKHEDFRIEKVSVRGDRYEIMFDGACGAGAVTTEMAKVAGIEPAVGMTIRFYPGGMGHLIRGVMIDGVMLFYRTPEAQARKQEAERKAEDARKEAELASTRAERDARRAALPEVFQRRLNRFEANNPHWRRDSEGYEMSCCTDAVKIAAALKTTEAIQAWAKLDYQAQRDAVPDLFDGHSGNSFGFAVRLAYHYVSGDPENVVREHGALCTLVGCVEYGCRVQ